MERGTLLGGSRGRPGSKLMFVSASVTESVVPVGLCFATTLAGSGGTHTSAAFAAARELGEAPWAAPAPSPSGPALPSPPGAICEGLGDRGHREPGHGSWAGPRVLPLAAPQSRAGRGQRGSGGPGRWSRVAWERVPGPRGSRGDGEGAQAPGAGTVAYKILVALTLPGWRSPRSGHQDGMAMGSYVN